MKDYCNALTKPLGAYFNFKNGGSFFYEQRDLMLDNSVMACPFELDKKTYTDKLMSCH